MGRPGRRRGGTGHHPACAAPGLCLRWFALLEFDLVKMISEIAESSGTTNQVEWAKIIKRRVAVEFDRVAAAFRANDQAGYFIRDWQDIGDQVRQMILHDG